MGAIVCVAGCLAAGSADAAPAVARPDDTIGEDVMAAGRQWLKGDVAGRAALEQMASVGRADAQETLGELLVHRSGSNPADAVAGCAYFKAAASKRRDALHSLAFCTERGILGPKDDAAAAELYRRAAELGFAKSMCALGNLYQAGRGVAKDVTRGVALCRQGAEAGDADAQTDLGNVYLMGRSVPKDVREARVWYERAAAQRQRNAEFILGQIYWNGDGVERDREKAATLWRRAYEDGRTDASLHLGDWALVRWTAAHAKGDLTVLDEAIAWVRGRHEGRPGTRAARPSGGAPKRGPRSSRCHPAG